MGSVRVYLPDGVIRGIRRAYPEARSDGEAVALFILETLAGVVDARELPEEAFYEAAGELLRLNPERYGRLLGIVPRSPREGRG